jgi:hypothetical protein
VCEMPPTTVAYTCFYQANLLKVLFFCDIRLMSFLGSSNL